MRLLAEKLALVTGAARGNGFAIARAMAAAGAHVVLTDVDHEAVASAAARLRDEGWSTTGHAADVTDLRGCQENWTSS